MNNLALQNLTESIAIKYFGKAFKHEVYYNKRLRTTGGRYILSSHNIEINPKQYEMFGEKAVIDIIKHELCHYFLHLAGEGYQHRDKAFKILSAKVGAPRFCTPTESYQDRANYKYRCIYCEQEFIRIKRVNLEKMRCGRCGGILKLLQTRK